MASHPAVLAALGLFVGIIGSLVGVGGGFLMVPYFDLLAGLPSVGAVGTSLGVLSANAASSTAGFLRQKRIDLALGWTLGLFTIPGTVLGKWVGTRMDAGSFRIAFGIMVAVAAILILAVRKQEAPGIGWFRRGRPRRLVDRTGRVFEYSANLPALVALSLLVGVLSALFGVGGGFFFVPLLILLFGIPTHIAMATAQMVILISSITAVVGYSIDGSIRWDVVVIMAPAAVVGAQIGSRIALRASSRALRLCLAVVLIADAAVMIWKGLN